jgi:hypothetical protein
MNHSPCETKLIEEAKRERNWDPALRWKVIQETITWADQQATAGRNTPAACLERQRQFLGPDRPQKRPGPQAEAGASAE